MTTPPQMTNGTEPVPSESTMPSGSESSGPPQLIQQLDLPVGPNITPFVASAIPLPPSPVAPPAQHEPPIPTVILLNDNAHQQPLPEPSPNVDAGPPSIPTSTRPHAQVRAAMDQAGLAALDALERHVSLTAGDLTLLKRLNVVAKDQVFHSLVHMQDAVAQWNHARSLEDLVQSRLAALDVLVSRADRLLARATLLERVVNEAARDVAAAAGNGVTAEEVLKAGTPKEEKRRSRFAIPSWFGTSSGGSAGGSSSVAGGGGGGDSGGGGREDVGGEREQVGHSGGGGGGGRQRQV